MVKAEVFHTERVDRALDLKPDDQRGILNAYGGSEGVFAKGHVVHRAGHLLTVGSAEEAMHVQLIRITSSADADYATRAEEAAASGMPIHHPV